MPFQYKNVLLIGATAGIGLGFAERLVAEGSKVIVVGRRKERLDAFVAKHGPTKAASICYDITDTAGLPGFVRTVTESHPELDCVFLNAGTQYLYDLTKSDVDLARFHAEFATNFTHTVNLSQAFLPSLSSKNSPTSIIFTGSNLALVPGFNLSAYCASKAALNVYIMCLRDQLKHANSNVSIVELWPPPVQTELHDYIPGGRSFGMPLEEYINQAYPPLANGNDLVITGSIGAEEKFLDVAKTRRELFDQLNGMIRARANA